MEEPLGWERVEDTAYAHLAGRIRGMEARMLTASDFGRLAGARSVEDLLRLLRDTDYRVVADAVQAGEEPAAALERMVDALYAEVRALSPDPSPVDLVRAGRALTEAARRTRAGSVPEGELAREAAPGVAERQARNEPPHVVDVCLEQARFKVMLRHARAAGSERLRDLVAFWADLANLQAMLRAKLLGRRAAFLAGKLVDAGGVPLETFLEAVGERWEQLPALFRHTDCYAVAQTAAEEAVTHGRLDGLAKAVDDALTARARMFRRLAMGPEVVSGFLLGREVEARNLRLLLWGVRLGVPAAELQGRLREPYV